MINGTHHTTISTADLDRALGFYCDLLGFELKVKDGWETGDAQLDAIVGFEDSAARFAMVWTGNTHLEFFEYQNPKPLPIDDERRVCDQGYTHICLDVTDIDSEYERLKEAGMEFTTAPQSAFGARSTYGLDPDGNVIELQEILDWDAVKLPPRPR